MNCIHWGRENKKVPLVLLMLEQQPSGRDKARTANTHAKCATQISPSSRLIQQSWRPHVATLWRLMHLSLAFYHAPDTVYSAAPPRFYLTRPYPKASTLAHGKGWPQPGWGVILSLEVVCFHVWVCPIFWPFNKSCSSVQLYSYTWKDKTGGATLVA